MKLSIWQAKPPATVDHMKDDFAQKLGAFRAVTGRPERFVTRCACATHDKEFIVVYERTDPARRFILSGIYKDGEGDAPGSAGVPRTRTLSAAEIDHTGWRCPYCSNRRHIGCHECHATVCGGKTHSYLGTSDIFNCRTSCGARGTLTDASTVSGIEPTRQSSKSKPMADRQGTVPSGDLLRLGPTRPPRLR